MTICSLSGVTLVCHDLITSFMLNLLYFMSSWPYLNTTFNNLNVLINIEMMMSVPVS